MSSDAHEPATWDGKAMVIMLIVMTVVGFIFLFAVI